ncbi:MAG: hypothetical protein BWY98_00411 [Tenericutes bacterium ADurb.BinA155]|jgi:hypothetical protein|nr:MAG: hypothetical protein BWY98_00411 [Tenericutes bacterium ADurb.BinA155]
MKKIHSIFLGAATLLVSLPLLGGCGDTPVTKVGLDQGQLYDTTNDDVNNPNGHFYLYNKTEDNSTSYFIPYVFLGKLIDQKASFVLVVVGSSDGCSCWSVFRNKVLVPYMKEHNLQVYLIRANTLQEGSDHYGLNIYSSSQNVAIIKSGALAYQHQQLEGQAFSDDYSTFASWMDSRLTFSPMLEVNNAQLDALYTGKYLGASQASLQQFTILFSFFDCPDCQFLNSSLLRSYIAEHTNLETFYMIDVGVNGIRWDKGATSKEQWLAWKTKYGLTSDNEAGYKTGYVPTLFNVQCTDAGTKVGDVIEGAATVYNDTVTKASDGKCTLTDTYFTEARLATKALSYLKDSTAVTTKVLTDYSLGTYSGTMEDPNDDRTWYHAQTEGVTTPIVTAFLDTYVGQGK